MNSSGAKELWAARWQLSVVVKVRRQRFLRSDEVESDDYSEIVIDR